MISLQNISKLFNKGKGNELTVLKNINLELPDKGLVVILGESGSGKTTLLNIIAGLDKSSGGTIVFGDEEFSTYKSKRWDKLRNDKIGFVFQNYNLHHELTVFDNIEMVLKMKGLSDPIEIKEKIDYITNELGLYNYQDRKSNALSGGQQQRVAIARSLVKNPDVIIADEPTGNLDSKTTVEIMNIIKKISKEKLVLMVTHEDQLAEFYADRIIIIKDGEIEVDKVNSIDGKLEVHHDHIIYLKDLDKEQGTLGNVDIITYTDDLGNKLDNIGVQIIQRNDTLYLKIDSNKYKRIKQIDKYSEINLLDETYSPQTISTNELFDSNKLALKTEDLKQRSVISIKDSIKYSLRKIDNLTYGGKMLYFALGLVGMMIAISIGLIGGIFNIDDSEFIVTSRNYVNIRTTDLLYDEVVDYEDYEFIEEVNFISEQIEFLIETEAYYEVRNPIRVMAHPSNIELIDESNIIFGRLPTSTYEIVIDQMIADSIIQSNSERGTEDYQDIIHMNIKLLANGLEGDYRNETSLEFKIVGVSNDDSPTIWLDEGLAYSIAMNNMIDYRILGDGFELVSGVMPTEEFQVIIHEDSSLIRNNEIPTFVGIESGHYQVVGTFRYTVDGEVLNVRNLIATNLEIMKYAYYKQSDIDYSKSEFIVYVTDIDLAIEELTNLGVSAVSNYQNDLIEFREFEFVNSVGLYVFSLVGIISSGISTLFIMRSSLTSRIYEVSVYRALGASKRDIRKMFMVEITIISSMSSLIGYFLMVFILMQAQSQVSVYVEILHYNVPTFMIGIVSLYLVNIIFGIIPVNVLLLKTPAEILKQYDL